MAAAHVAGVIALLITNRVGLCCGQYEQRLLDTATPDRIVGNPLGTPNLLLFKTNW
jgi:hypothetical protein